MNVPETMAAPGLHYEQISSGATSIASLSNSRAGGLRSRPEMPC